MKKRLRFMTSVMVLIFAFLPVSIMIQPSTAEQNMESTLVSQATPAEGTSVDLLNFTSYELSIVPNVSHASGYFGCGVTEVGCGILNVIYSIVISVGNFLVGVSAYVMDFFLEHSLNSSSYKGSGFIEQGWEILRDLTNIIFIFALVYSAFSIVLGFKAADAKKRLLKVILIALTINFSLYISYAVIDMGNITAHIFYGKIATESVELEGIGKNQSAEKIENAGVSLGIAKKVNPQQILSKFEAEANRTQKFIGVIMAGIVNFALIYVFLSVTFLFLGRTISLMFSAILAPLAFASITVPGLEGLPYIGFRKWLNDLLSMSFMAPVFIFLLYLAVQFMNIGFKATTGAGFLDRILAVVIPMATIVVLILTAKKVATQMSSEIGRSIGGIIAKAAGGAVALGAVAVTGGAAAVGGLSGAGAGAFGRFKNWRNQDGSGDKWIKRGQRWRSTKVRSINLEKIPGFGKTFANPVSSFLGKNISGKSVRGAEHATQMGVTKAKNWIKQDAPFIGDGRSFEESEAAAKKALDKEKKDAATWQDSLVDSKSADDIKAADKDLRSKTVDPKTGNPSDASDAITQDAFIDGLKKAISQGVTINATNAGPEKISYTDSFGHSRNEDMVDSSGTAITRVEFENKRIKKLKKHIKDAERDLANKRATGTAAEITSASNALDYAEDELAAFEKQTVEGLKKKTESLEKNIRNIARENVAQRHDKSDKRAAARIRSGRVKVDDSSDDKK